MKPLKPEIIEMPAQKMAVVTSKGDPLPKDQWTAHWALPIPNDTEELTKKSPDMPVRIEVWEYGTVAQVLHIGPYSEEGPTVVLLHKFIEDSGYKLSGPHEEEYLTSPTAKVQKTLIRYQIGLQ